MNCFLLFYYKTESFILKVIEKLENQKITLISWLVSLFAIIYPLRIILATFSVSDFYFQPQMWFFLFFHISSLYFFEVLIIIFILYFFTKEKIEKISKIALFAFWILLLPPIIDLIVSAGQGGMIVGFVPFAESPTSILSFFQKFLMFILYGPQGIFFGGGVPPYINPEVSVLNYGIRIQINLALLGLIWYIFLKTKNIFRVLGGAIFFYFAAFLLIHFSPEISKLSLYSSLNPLFESGHLLFTLFFIGICFLVSLWFYIYNKEKFFSLFGNLRLSRTIHNIVLLGLGLYLGGLLTFNLNLADILLIILAIISLLFWLFWAIGRDDILDQEIDSISNSFRPLPSGKFTKEEFQVLNSIFLIVAHLIAFVAGYTFFLCILFSSFVGYLYNAPPFRLKRFPLLATLSRGLIFLFIIFAGFLLISTNTINDFPRKLALFIIVAFTLGITVKDIKDYQGDKVGGVYTIPVIFGLARGKKIIGLLALSAFISCPLFFFNYFKTLIGPAFLAGALSFYLIQGKRTKWKEFFLFLIYFSFGFFFILTVFSASR